MLCDVCGQKIINPDRSWPRANNVPTEPVYMGGQEIKESHLGCFRLAREYGAILDRRERGQANLHVVK